MDNAAMLSRQALIDKATAALVNNAAYLAQPALPAGTALTTTQLTTAMRIMRAQIDALTRQTNALIRLQLGEMDGGDT